MLQGVTMLPGEYPGSNAAPTQLIRLKKRLSNLQLLLTGIEKQAANGNSDTATQLINRAKANSLTANNLSDTAEIVANQSAIEALRAGSVSFEVTVVSFEDVAELDALKQHASPLPGSPDQIDQEPLITFSPRGGCTTCASPDPSKWFEQIHSDEAQEPTPPSCQSPRVLVAIPIDLNSKTTRVDELIKLTESTIVLAETQIRQARMAICHSGDACSL